MLLKLRACMQWYVAQSISQGIVVGLVRKIYRSHYIIIFIFHTVLQFNYASSFNQNISQWKVSRVLNMEYMVRYRNFFISASWETGSFCWQVFIIIFSRALPLVWQCFFVQSKSMLLEDDLAPDGSSIFYVFEYSVPYDGFPHFTWWSFLPRMLRLTSTMKLSTYKTYAFTIFIQL